MKLHHPNAEAIARQYIGVDRTLEVLGWGVGGAVFASPVQSTAIKVHLHADGFEREVAAYRRLQQHHVSAVLGFAVPEFIDANASLRVVEMTIVRPPYLLDFANARVDSPPDFDAEVMSEWWQRLADRFGDRLLDVRAVYETLIQQYGIYYFDLKPGNIEFGEQPHT